MCILLNVKKHEKTFALNVDIFKVKIFLKNVLTEMPTIYIINLALLMRQQDK